MSDRSKSFPWERVRVPRESIALRLAVGLGALVFAIGLSLFAHALVGEEDSFPAYSMGVVAAGLMAFAWRGIYFRTWGPDVEKNAALFFAGLACTFIGLRLGIYRELNAAFTPLVLGTVLTVCAVIRLRHHDEH